MQEKIDSLQRDLFDERSKNEDLQSDVEWMWREIDDLSKLRFTAVPPTREFKTH